MMFDDLNDEKFNNSEQKTQIIQRVKNMINIDQLKNTYGIEDINIILAERNYIIQDKIIYTQSKNYLDNKKF